MGLKQIDELAAKGELTGLILLEDFYETLTDAGSLIQSGIECDEPWAPHPVMGSIVLSALNTIALDVLGEVEAWKAHDRGECDCTPEQRAEVAEREKVRSEFARIAMTEDDEL